MLKTKTSVESVDNAASSAVTDVIDQFPDHEIEEIPEAGFTIIRGALDATHVKDLEAELKEIMDQFEDNPHSPNKPRSVHANINQERFATDLITREGFLAIINVFKKLGTTHGYQAVINHQKPGGVQQFHADDNRNKVEVSETRPLYLVQASDGGYLDYSPGTTVNDSDEIAQKNAIEVPVNAGDIIIQTDPDVIHRGRNGSGHDRYNIVVFSERELLTFEEAIKESQADTWD